MLVTSGGKAPGPQPLKDCIHHITKVLDNKKDGEKLTPIETHDIVCHIADAVLAGGIRRAALISLFSADDEEMISCKSGNWWEQNAQRGRANNSAVLLRHKITKEFFMDLWKRIELSGAGEPGIYLSNDKDWGTNPCCEIALRPFQFCNLCEVNASDIESQEDFDARVKAASFIGTLQAGYTDFHYLRDIWKRTTEKDALIGVGMTGRR
jgi:ribonucleoside-diphosphate reductase alpha chain